MTSTVPPTTPGTALSGPVRSPAMLPPQPLDKAALKLQLQRLQDPELLELQNQLAGAYDGACKALIGPNDVQKEGDREFKKKSAWRKLSRYFGISTEILTDELRMLPDDEFLAVVRVRALAPWGQACEAIAACGSDEESGRRTITMADAMATAQTRAINRAISDLIAMGEVSADELSKRAGKERPAGEPELQLEEALELEFPWADNKKYGGKPLKDVSTRMLLSVGKWAKAKIDAGSAGKKITRLYQATILIVQTRPDLETVISAQAAAEDRDDAEQQAAGGKVDSDGAAAVDGAAADPTAAAAPTSGESSARSSASNGAATAPPSSSPTAAAASASSSEERIPDDDDDDEGAGLGDHVGTYDSGPLVDDAPPAKEKTVGELAKQMLGLIDDPRLEPAEREKWIAKAAAGELKSAEQLKRAIGQLTLILETTP